MANTDKPAFKFALFLLGIGVSSGIYWLCCRSNAFQRQQKNKRERLQEIAVEDSFPASDPPASW